MQWTITSLHSVTVQEIAYTGFRLVPTSMTLNDLERRNMPYFAFFPSNSTYFQASSRLLTQV